jgi:hypothetical protein
MRSRFRSGKAENSNIQATSDKCDQNPDREEKTERHERLDLAGQVARHDCGRRQRPTLAVDHAQADHPLARRRALPRQLEMDEVEIADGEGQEQHDRHGDRQAHLIAEREGAEDDEDEYKIDRDGRDRPKHPIDEKRGQPLAGVGEIEEQGDAFRRCNRDPPPAGGAALQEFGGAAMARYFGGHSRRRPARA